MGETAKECTTPVRPGWRATTIFGGEMLLGDQMMDDAV